MNFLNLNSGAEEMDKLFQSLRIDFDAPGEREIFISNLVDRGLNLEDPQHLYETELLLSETFDRNTYLAYGPNMKITFGNIVKP